MRHLCVLLVIAGVFFGSAKAISTLTDLTPSAATSKNSLIAGKDDVPDRKLLTTTAATAGKDKEHEEQSANVLKDDDERGFSADFLASIDVLTSKMGTLPMKIFQPDIANDLFTISGLRNAQKTLLERKEFILWYNIVKKNYPQNANEEIVSTLLQEYSDGELYNIFDAGKIGASKEIAQELQTALVKIWQDEQKSPVDVYEYMKVDSNFLNSPHYSAWRQYLHNYNNNVSKDQMLNECDVLLHFYTLNELKEMLREAKNDATTMEEATDLLTQVRTSSLNEN